MKKALVLSIIIIFGLGSVCAQEIVPKAPPSAWENPTGKYRVIMEVDETLPNHTIYRPVDLTAFPINDNLPIIVMSGPGCDFDGDSYRPFWTEIASHGYLIVAVGPPVPEGTRAPTFYNKAKDLLAGIDWAFAENSRKESKYYSKIDTANVVLMGQSCGGSLVSKIADDPRVSLLTFWNSGVVPFVGGSQRTGTGSDGRFQTNDPEMNGNPDFLNHLKVPIAYFVGEKDMLRPNSLHDFNLANNVPAFFAVRDIPGDAHGGTFREVNGGGWGVAGVAWVNWNTKGDMEAAKMFLGTPSGLESSDVKWVEVIKKNIDPKGASRAGGQSDWAAFKRYEKANKEITGTTEIVFMGNSITDYWVRDDPDFFKKNNFIGRGISGQTASQMLVRFRQDVINLKPKAVVIMAGTNDLAQQMAAMSYYPEANIVGNIISMCELARASNIKVLLCSITPCAHYMVIPKIAAGPEIININNQLKAYADATKDVTYVDYFTPLANSEMGLDNEMSYDGIHPNKYCYFFMEEIVTKSISQALGNKTEYYVIPRDTAKQRKEQEDKERIEKHMFMSFEEIVKMMQSR
jgi:lysophospholipase L1-like esterase